MTPEAQRIAIAEACGWRHTSQEVWLPGGSHHIITNNSALWWVRLPDYLNDLNAMHEAEKGLTDRQFDAFQKEISRIVFLHPCAVTYPVGFKCRDFWHATAAQRAEAFLRTLNLWDERK